MPRSRITSSGMPQSASGSHRDKDQRDASFSVDIDSRAIPSDTEQLKLGFGKRQEVINDIRSMYALVGAMVRARGGIERLTSDLDREPSYASKISEALNGRDGRHLHLDHFAALISDEAAAALLISWLHERLDLEPPVKRRRDIDEGELNAAAREAIAELDADQREAFRKKLARKLGVRVEDVRL